MTAASKKTKPKTKRSASPPSSTALPAWDSISRHLHVLVDTPRGSGVKFKLDVEKRCYTISHILPPGTVFPFDFGSIPGTLAEDGDPLDVLILMETPAFSGCLVPVRLIGALEAKQTQEGKTNRNDRLIGVAAESRTYREIHELDYVPAHLLAELEHFFVSYNEERGRRFRVLRRVGPERAKRLVASGERRFRRKEG